MAGRTIADTVLTWSLRAGAAYFVCVTIVHWAGLKVPGLFIFYNVPSYDYQDRCIGTLCFGWAVFIFAASRHRSLVPAVLTAGLAGLLGFSMITLSPEVARLVEPPGVAGIWLILLSLAGYLAWVAVWSMRSRKAGS